MKRIFNAFKSVFSSRKVDLQHEKQQIRHTIKHRKKTLTEGAKLAAEQAVFAHVEKLEVFKNARTVMMYWALQDEIPTQHTIAKWCEYKTVVLPVIKDNRLLIKQYVKGGAMVRKDLGIYEPDLLDTYKSKVDLIIVPGIAFDKSRNRLGRGKGYYDRFFQKQHAVKIGVGFDFQLIDWVPVERHDKPMDYVLTPKLIIH